MAEIKEFKPSLRETPKPEKPADIVDIEQARDAKAFVFPNTESEELMETVSSLLRRLFDDSSDKKMVVTQLRNLVDDLEQELEK